MTGFPEVMIGDAERSNIEQLHAVGGSLATIELDALTAGELTRRAALELRALRRRLLEQWQRWDHVVVRGLPRDEHGISGLLMAAAFLPTLKPYKGGQVVKHFRMSPWTTALSHTLASGSFHSDINTAASPPAATVIQCLDADPCAPAYGQLRVARVAALLEELEATRRDDALRFLKEDRVSMVNETSPSGWSGRIMDGEVIRFHPESLRAGQRRTGSNPQNLEELLRVIHEAALAVSVPIHLDPGDLLIVSNRRALHQRGACTVRFRQFPRDFDARRIAVLHAIDEPA